MIHVFMTHVFMKHYYKVYILHYNAESRKDFVLQRCFSPRAFL